MVIYPNEHRPAHVHVIAAEEEAAFDLNCPAGPAIVRENYGFSHPQINRIERELRPYVEQLCGEGERIHGEF